MQLTKNADCFLQSYGDHTSNSIILKGIVTDYHFCQSEKDPEFLHGNADEKAIRAIINPRTIKKPRS